MNDFFSQTSVYAVQCHDKIAHVSFYRCFYSNRNVAKEHCRLMNSNQSRYFFKVKKVSLFHTLNLSI